MHALGVDLGSARVGLAFSNELGMLAFPLETVPAKKALDRILALVAERGVKWIIVGHPRNMDGSFGPAADAARRFRETLAARTTARVELWDERLTTRLAERMLAADAGLPRKLQRDIIDQLAAQQILQSWLDAREARASPPEPPEHG